MNSFSQLEQSATLQAAASLDIIRSVKVHPVLLGCEIECSYLQAPELPQPPLSSFDYLSDDLIHKPKKPAKEKHAGPPVKRKLVHPFNGFAVYETSYLRRELPAAVPSEAPEVTRQPVAESPSLPQDQKPTPVYGVGLGFPKQPQTPNPSLRKRPPALRFSYLNEFRRIRSLIKKCKN